MIIIAASLYLPEHIATVLGRAWFYYAGDESAHVSASRSNLGRKDLGNIGVGGLGAREAVGGLGI